MLYKGDRVIGMYLSLKVAGCGIGMVFYSIRSGFS